MMNLDDSPSSVNFFSLPSCKPQSVELSCYSSKAYIDISSINILDIMLVQNLEQFLVHLISVASADARGTEYDLHWRLCHDEVS